MKFNNIIETIGKTPLVRINRLFPEAEQKNIEVWAKIEKGNPGGSIKDRIAKSMIEDAEKEGTLKKGMIIVEPTSGNTGVSLAMVCAIKGYRLILTMPESMSVERRRLMTIYGAELVLTPKEKGMKGAIDRALELIKENNYSWMPMQFENPSNPRIHLTTTAQEIIEDFGAPIDYLIAGVGTGGHITSCAEVLKEKYSNLKVLAVEPYDSPILSGGTPGPHAIQGIGAGFIPKILKQNLLNEVVTVTKDEAFYYTREVARVEGILVGISSGANLAAVAKKISAMPNGSRVVTFCYDTGERYLSIDGLFTYK